MRHKWHPPTGDIEAGLIPNQAQRCIKCGAERSRAPNGGSTVTYSIPGNPEQLQHAPDCHQAARARA